MDAVVLWVDGADPVWRKKKNDYLVSIGQKPSEDSDSRYRDWGIMRYWFRAIEQNLPWLEHIFFVSDDQVPAFLDTGSPKLRIVRHTDFIPKEYLPCFSSRAIELNLFRIPDLSDEFLLFNDDFFMNAPAKPTDFFRNGKPCLTYAEDVFTQKRSTAYFCALFNNMTLINRHFDKREMVKKHWRKFFSPRNGNVMVKNLLLASFSAFSYLRHIHGVPYPLLKSTMAEIWEKEPEVLERTCRHRFRSNDDVNTHLVLAWDEARGNFEPTPIRGTYYNFGLHNADAWSRDIREAKQLSLCLNDPGDTIDMTTEEEERLRTKLKEVFESRYPERSSFERA